MMITIPQQNIRMDQTTGIDPVWYDKLKQLIDRINLLPGLGSSAINGPITASLGADVLLNNTALYFDGPHIAQGTTGTWFVSGTVTVLDSGSAANFFAKLWDGNAVIASAAAGTASAALYQTINLSGFISSPAANLRISVRETTAVTGKILFNATGNSKDATISAFRIA